MKNNLIKADLYRYGALSGCTGFLKGMLIPGFRYMFFLRKASSKKRNSMLGIIYRLILRHYSYKFGFQIPADTKIGAGFYIGHHGTIVINGSSLIGKNCNIAHLVTIGQANRGKYKGYPVIGDNVWIGTGTVIVGKIIIGSNVLIAPNSYVNRDVPDHSIAFGNPFRIVERNNPCEGYINWIKDV